MGSSHILLHNKNFHPFVHNVLIVSLDKFFCHFFVFRGQWLNAFLVAHMNIHKFSVQYDKFKNTFAIGIAHMYMNWFVLP